MQQDSAHDTVSLSDDAPNFAWREWVSFFGSVLGTALLVSILLGGVVLVLSAGGG